MTTPLTQRNPQINPDSHGDVVQIEEAKKQDGVPSDLKARPSSNNQKKKELFSREDKINAVVYAVLFVVFLAISIGTGIGYKRCGAVYLGLSCFLAFIFLLMIIPFFNQLFLQPATRPKVFLGVVLLYSTLLYAVATVFTFMVGAFAIISAAWGLLIGCGIIIHALINRSDNAIGAKKNDGETLESRSMIAVEAQPIIPVEDTLEYKDRFAILATIVVIVLLVSCTTGVVFIQQDTIWARWTRVSFSATQGQPLHLVAAPSIPWSCFNGQFKNLTALPDGILLDGVGILSGIPLMATNTMVPFHIACLGGTFTLGVAPVTFDIASARNATPPYPLCPLEDPLCTVSLSSTIPPGFQLPIESYFLLGAIIIRIFVFTIAVVFLQVKKRMDNWDETRPLCHKDAGFPQTSDRTQDTWGILQEVC